MAKNLMESIAEDEAAIAEAPETQIEEDNHGNEPSIPARDKPTPERSSSIGAEGGREGTEGDGRRRGRVRGTGRASGKSPQSEGDASREDGEASPRDGGGTRKDAAAPHEGGDANGRDDGRTGQVLDDDDKAPVPSDHAAWAKLRRENRELAAKIRAAEGKPPIAAIVPPPEAIKPDAKTTTEAEPDKATSPEAWREWKDRQLEEKYAKIEQQLAAEAKIKEDAKVYSQAIGEYNQIRDDYIKKNPDYIPAFTHSFDVYAKAIKMQYPHLSTKQITDRIDSELLQYAGLCVSKGLNPAEELYDMAIERFGYAPNSAKAAAEADDGEEEVDAPRAGPTAGLPPSGIKNGATQRPNLRNIANNRKRAASPLIGGGQGSKGALTKEAVAGMTNGEMMNLSPEEWADLERMGAA